MILPTLEGSELVKGIKMKEILEFVPSRLLKSPTYLFRRRLIFANLFFGHFAGINICELGFTEDFAGINFCELSVTKDFAGINFRESTLYKYFTGVNLTFALRKIFSRP